MTIEIAPTLGDLPPLDGSAAEVTTFADNIIAASTSLEQYQSLADDQTVISGWQGEAAAAYKAYADQAADDAVPAATALKEVARAADVYASALTTLSSDRAAIVSSRSTYASDRQDLIADATGYDTEDSELVSRLESRAHDLQTSYNSLDQTTTDWLTDLSDADEAMNAAFARYLNLSAAQNAPTGGSATAAADSALNKNGAPGSGATADEVARWWDNLTDEQRAALITEYPEVIGGADGLPTDVRDRANRINLDADLAELEHEEDQGTLGTDQRKELDTARSVSNALNGLDKEGNPFPQFDENGEPIKNPSTPPIDPITGKPVETFLLVYKPEAHGGDGGVAISIGDPGTADNVAVTVPGIRTEGDDSANGTRDAYNAYSSARFSDPSGSTASIFWLDYDSPSSDDVVPDMIFQDEANKGAKNLNSFVRGLTENNPSAHYTAIGHSYGSVVVAQSGADHNLPVDDFVLIGSPGPGRDIDHATDLGVSADHVFIGDASDDNVSKLSDGPGLHGVDVTREGFGGVRFQAESPDRDLNNPLNFDGHSRYFVPESESLNNIGQIIVGDRDEVTEAEYEYNKVTRGRVPVSIHIDPESKREPTVVEREPEW